MSIHNREIANLFLRLADLLEVEGANPFRVRAYRNAARTVGDDTQSMSDLLDKEEDLSKLPGIGKDIAKKIETIVQTGKLPILEEVEGRTPAALSELMKIEGLGPKRVKSLHDQLSVNTLEDLERAARSGKIRELEGFGKKTEGQILQRLEHFNAQEKRSKLIDAEATVGPLIEYLREYPAVSKVIAAGSYRRRKETVGDLDLLITARKDSGVMDYFVGYPEVREVISKGGTRSSVRLHSGLSVDLRVVPTVSYGAALHYFTGSKAHNIAIRTLGVKKGYKINEYGVFKNDTRLAGRTEKEVYETVGLPFIDPELREQRGEIEAAQQNRLPKLVRLRDIRGDLHCHTKATDGKHSLEQMVQAARDKGYEYLAITDHSKHLSVARGLDSKRLIEQIRTIDKLNEKLSDFVVLKAIEVDILESGELDLPDSVLRELDFTVCSVHYKFDLPRKKQTERIVRAMDNPYFNVLGHPSGRLINKREAYDVDLEAVMKAARDRGCHLEVNAQPDRMDLSDDACILAKQLGLKVTISTDAHSTGNLDFMRFGVDQARRGWLEKKDVLNTRSLAQLRKLFKRDRGE